MVSAAWHELSLPRTERVSPEVQVLHILAKGAPSPSRFRRGVCGRVVAELGSRARHRQSLQYLTELGSIPRRGLESMPPQTPSLAPTTPKSVSDPASPYPLSVTRVTHGHLVRSMQID